MARTDERYIPRYNGKPELGPYRRAAPIPQEVLDNAPEGAEGFMGRFEYWVEEVPAAAGALAVQETTQTP